MAVFCRHWRFDNSPRQSISVSTAEITAPEIRLVGEEGEQLGIVSLADAMRTRRKRPSSTWSRSRRRPSRRFAGSWITASSSTARAKKQHEAKLKQKQIQVKEVKFRPGTDEGDYQIKLRNLIRFLTEGDKAKVTLRFRGREMAHQEFGVRLLERIRSDLGAARVVESFPRLEGRQMVMLLAPKKTVLVQAGHRNEAVPRPSLRPVRPSPPKPLRNDTREHRREQQTRQRKERRSCRR